MLGFNYVYLKMFSCQNEGMYTFCVETISGLLLDTFPKGNFVNFTQGMLNSKAEQTP